MQSMIKNRVLFFVSIIGIILVSSVMATTYAYQTLRVDYVSGSKDDLNIASGVLDVSFSVTNKIDIKSMPLLPSYKTADYIEFVVDNTKSTGNVAYKISLVDLEYSENIANGYFRYTLVKETEDNKLEEIGNGSFANLSSNYITLYFDSGIYDYIDAGQSYKIRLYLWLKESKNVNQIKLTNATFKGKISIDSVFDTEVNLEKASEIFEVGTIADKIIGNAYLGLNGTQYSPNPMTVPAMDSNEPYEKTISIVEDDYGKSYYYRGNVKNNYINYNNMCWRIVRINGDGSIKLVLEDTKPCEENIKNNSGLISNESGIVNVKNDLLGKEDMYGYLTKELNDWYINNKFESLIGDLKLEKICTNGTKTYTILDTDKDKYTLRSDDKVYGIIDKTLNEMTEEKYRLQCNKNIENNYFIENEENIYCNEWYYDIYIRLYGINNDKYINNLKCNNYFENYIGILNADEIVLAGYTTEDNNTINYLSNSKDYWTSSIAYLSLDKENMFYVGNNLLTNAKSDNYGIRPTITLNAGKQYNNGDGTSSNPYTIK